jgi:hypothetical protein
VLCAHRCPIFNYLKIELYLACQWEIALSRRFVRIGTSRARPAATAPAAALAMASAAAAAGASALAPLSG